MCIIVHRCQYVNGWTNVSYTLNVRAYICTLVVANFLPRTSYLSKHWIKNLQRFMLKTAHIWGCTFQPSFFLIVYFWSSLCIIQYTKLIVKNIYDFVWAVWCSSWRNVFWTLDWSSPGPIPLAKDEIFYCRNALRYLQSWWFSELQHDLFSHFNFEFVTNDKKPFVKDIS